MKPLADLTDDELLHVVRASADLEDAPESVVQAAIALWPRSVPGGGLAGSLAALASGLVDAGVRRLRAVLESDSAAPAFANGLRSTASPIRHLLFSAEGFDVDLRVISVEYALEISGQVLGPEEGGRVELRSDAADPAGEPLQRSGLDAFGEFRFEPVRLSAVVLTVVLSTAVFDLPPIELGPPSE